MSDISQEEKVKEVKKESEQIEESKITLDTQSITNALLRSVADKEEVPKPNPDHFFSYGMTMGYPLPPIPTLGVCNPIYFPPDYRPSPCDSSDRMVYSE